MKFLVNKDNNFDMVGGGTNLELDTNTIGLGLKNSVVSIPSYDELFNAIEKELEGEFNPNLIYTGDNSYIWKVSNSVVDFTGTVATLEGDKCYFDHLNEDDESKITEVVYKNDSGEEVFIAITLDTDNSELYYPAGTYILVEAELSEEDASLQSITYPTFIGYHNTVNTKFLSPEMPLSDTDGRIVVRVKDGVATLAFRGSSK